MIVDLLCIKIHFVVFFFVALQEAQAELIQMYTSVTKSVDVLLFQNHSPGLPIANIFAPLLMAEDLKSKERMPNPEGNGCKKLKSLREIFHAGNKPAKRIFMKGEAGCGKTFFCLKLLDSWCQVKQSQTVSDDVLQQCLAVFDLVFYLPLRHFKDNLKSVKDMISQTVSEQCLSLLVSGGQRIHCLVILDGLDESPVTIKSLPGMHGIVSYVLLCTTRPWKLTQLQLTYSQDDKIVQMLGLLPSSEKKLMEYVLVDFYKLKKETQEFKKKFKRYSSMLKDSRIASLVKIPMMFTACCCMWYEEDAYFEKSKGGKRQSSKDLPPVQTSMTYTYLSLVDSMIRRANEKCDLRSVLMQALPYPTTHVPKVLASFLYIYSFLDTLLPLCRLAYTDLVSRETKLVFQKDELEKEIGGPLVEIALKVGIISQTKAPGRFHQQNVSVNFYNKSVQELLAAVHLTCTDTDDIRSYCTSLDKVMDVANIIMFGIALDPSFGHDVSNHVMVVVNTDPKIKQYRQTFHSKETVKQLYRTQCEWYRELTLSQTVTDDTSRLPSLHVTDIYLYHLSDSDTVRLTGELLSTNRDTIVSVWLWYEDQRLHKVAQLLPQCPNLSALCIGHMDSKENHDLLVSVIPRLTQLTTVRYNGSVLSDAAGRAVVAAIRTLTQLIWLRLGDVRLGDDGMEVMDSMTRLRKVELWQVSMTAEAWNRSFTSLLNLPQSVCVVLRTTNIDEGTLRRIQASPRVTDWRGRYEMLQFTTIPSKTVRRSVGCGVTTYNTVRHDGPQPRQISPLVIGAGGYMEDPDFIFTTSRQTIIQQDGRGGTLLSRYSLSRHDTQTCHKCCIL